MTEKEKLTKLGIEYFEGCIPEEQDTWTWNGKSFYDLEALLLNHEFAKAIWGNKRIYKTVGKFNGLPKPHLVEIDMYVWQYRLQEAVISKDRLDYYINNL